MHFDDLNGDGALPASSDGRVRPERCYGFRQPEGGAEDGSVQAGQLTARSSWLRARRRFGGDRRELRVGCGTSPRIIGSATGPA